MALAALVAEIMEIIAAVVVKRKRKIAAVVVEITTEETTVDAEEIITHSLVDLGGYSY